MILRNDCSIILNFLVYVSNVYKNYYEYSDEPKVFPFLYLEKNTLLSMDAFIDEISKYWENYIHSLHDRIIDNEVLTMDINFINKPNSFNYHTLFKNNIEGKETFDQILKSFKVWWFSPYNGYRIGDQLSGDVIPIVWEGIKNKLLTKYSTLPNYNFVLFAIYDNVPFSLQSKGSNFIIEPLSNLDLKYKDESEQSKSISCLVDKFTQKLFSE
ncbi:hypothetical protein ABNX05_17880 [Lysinibacillus sp. M3]|uniref:Uncharacterized protein n=1 Tax=Lysinibacillus zambalensis TaxID=3160866 RepID=A0ABV1MVG2_9BACI